MPARIACKRYRRPDLYPEDAELNWASAHSYSAAVVRRVAKAAGVVPFAQAAAQGSEAGAITIGKRQAEELAIGAAIDFEAFYAARPSRWPASSGSPASCSLKTGPPPAARSIPVRKRGESLAMGTGYQGAPPDQSPGSTQRNSVSRWPPSTPR